MSSMELDRMGKMNVQACHGGGSCKKVFTGRSEENISASVHSTKRWDVDFLSGDSTLRPRMPLFFLCARSIFPKLSCLKHPFNILQKNTILCILIPYNLFLSPLDSYEKCLVTLSC